MEPFLGMIVGFGGNFAPRGWALCDGQLLPVAQYSALYSILGTIYGGDGRSTFALPDLRGRAPIHAGNGPGLQHYRQGQHGGAESFSIQVSHMPAHTHTMHGETTAPSSANPQGKMLGLSNIYADVVAAEDRTFASQSIGVTGGGQAVLHRGPHLAIHYIIALQGIFPSRS